MATQSKKSKKDFKTRYTVFTNKRKDGNGEEFISYRLSIGKKNDDGEYENVYLKAVFLCDEKPEDGDRIEIEEMDLGVDIYDAKVVISEKPKKTEMQHFVKPMIWVKKFVVVG